MWNDAQKIKSSKGILTILPFAIENKNEINGFVIAQQDFQTNTYTFDVFNKNLLAQYGFDQNGKKLNAQKVQAVINYINYQKFNITSYKITDIRQIPADLRTKFPDKTDKTKLWGKLSFKNNTVKALSTGSSCFGFWVDTDWWWDPDGDGDPCHCSGNETYAYTVSTYESICSVDGSGGGNGGYGGGGFGDGGGGGGGITEIFPDLNTLGSYNDNDADYTTGDYDNTVIPDFDVQTQAWPVISSVIPVSQFVPYDYSNCYLLAKAQIAKLGYKISGYGDAGQTYVTYADASGVNANAAKDGVSYLISALQRGIPVMVGVDYKSGPSAGNPDNTTDHFIVIVGSGTDATGNYFQFYDNATNYSWKGASPSNKLYYNTATGTITGQTAVTYPNGTPLPRYTVTQIRKSK